MALQKAKQTALEEAGTYVQSYTKTLNQDLTTDEIQTIAGGVLQVAVLDKTRTLMNEGLRVSIKIKATVTTDKMEELASRIKGKNVAEEYIKLQTEYARLSRELKLWKQNAAKAPQGPERNSVLDQIREGEKAFARMQQSEAAFFERLASGQALMDTARNARTQIDSLIETIKDHAHVIEIGTVGAHEEKSSDKWFPWGNWPLADEVATLTIPVTMKVSDRLLSAISQTVVSLGGRNALIAHVGDSRGRNITVTFMVPRADAAYVTQRGHPLYFEDSVYREAPFAKVTELLPGTSLAPSGNQSLNQYFYKQLLPPRVPVIELILQGGETYSCTVPTIVNRIFSAKSSLLNNRYDIYLDRSSDTPIADSAILLTEGMKFSVEVLLSAKRAEQLDRVVGRFEKEEDAPRQMCRIIVEHF
ncbi:MAG: hypothetical protein CAF45_016330 [Nitrospira sp. CG24E]|nr:MAG: hypothetical protein CAF45_016330 [Nitrospira sp. CG24E]